MPQTRKYKTLRKVYKKNKLTKLQKDVNFLKKSAETKHTDDAVVITQVVEYDVNTIRVLADPNNSFTNQGKIGAQITPFRCMVKGRIESNVAADSAHIVRIMLVQSKQKFVPSTIASAGSPQSVLTLANTVNAPISMYDMNTRGKYTVKYDKTFIVDQDDPYKLFNINCKISRNIQFEDTSSTIAESGQLYLLFFSDSNAANPNVVYTTRVLYKDS